jgi:hypothetical protein
LRDEYHYGYSSYVLTAAAGVGELLMYIRLVQARRQIFNWCCFFG